MNRPPPKSYDDALDALRDVNEMPWTNPETEDEPSHLQVKKLNLLPSPLNTRTASETIFIIREKSKFLENGVYEGPYRDDLKFFVDQTCNGILNNGMKWYIRTVYNPLSLAVKGATFSPELFSDATLMSPINYGRQAMLPALPPYKSQMEESPLTFHKRGSDEKQTERSNESLL